MWTLPEDGVCFNDTLWQLSCTGYCYAKETKIKCASKSQYYACGPSFFGFFIPILLTTLVPTIFSLVYSIFGQIDMNLTEFLLQFVVSLFGPFSIASITCSAMEFSMSDYWLYVGYPVCFAIAFTCVINACSKKQNVTVTNLHTIKRVTSEQLERILRKMRSDRPIIQMAHTQKNATRCGCCKIKRKPTDPLDPICQVEYGSWEDTSSFQMPSNGNHFIEIRLVFIKSESIEDSVQNQLASKADEFNEPKIETINTIDHYTKYLLLKNSDSHDLLDRAPKAVLPLFMLGWGLVPFILKAFSTSLTIVKIVKRIGVDGEYSNSPVDALVCTPVVQENADTNTPLLQEGFNSFV